MNPSFQRTRELALQKHFVQKNYFSPKSNLFGYIHFRFLRPLLKLYTKYLLRKWKGTPIPWMTPAAIDILANVLTKNMKGFEFGSGRSTLFVAPRVLELLSLEHDEQWFSYINEELKKKKLSNVRYFHCAPANDPEKKTGYPKNNYLNYTMQPAPATCYTAYYSFIDQYAEEHFDFIIVDGRARVECAEHALSKLKKGGMLILDNSERARYQPIHKILSDWEKVNTTSGITDTTFWFKP